MPTLPAPTAVNKQALTRRELDFLKCSPGYAQITEPGVRAIFNELAKAALACDWATVEGILAKLVNTRMTPSALLFLADTDLGALVSHIHLQMPSPALAFSIRLATLCVAYWSDNLKLAANLLGEAQPPGSCQFRASSSVRVS